MPHHGRPSLVTQFVVGPAGESDCDLLTAASQLYREVNLSRAYYSAFNPVPDTPLADLPPTPAAREHRLYQADWLLRFYGFVLPELPFEPDGSLPSDVDPKLAWARQHLAHRPVDINREGRRPVAARAGHRSAQCRGHSERAPRAAGCAICPTCGRSASRSIAPRRYILFDGRRPDTSTQPVGCSTLARPMLSDVRLPTPEEEELGRKRAELDDPGD